MIQKSVLAVAAAQHGPTAIVASPAQHTAKPNAPPGFAKIDCRSRDLRAGETHKFLPAFVNAYVLQQCCIAVSNKGC